MGMIIVLLCAPFVLGGLWGATWQRGRGQGFSMPVLVTAPMFSAGVMGIIIATGTVFYAPFRGPQRSGDATVELWIWTAIGYGLSSGLLGAVPALVGSAAGQLGKLRLSPGDSRMPRSGSGDSQPTPDFSAT
jgi:hypothetical protein